MPYRKKLSTGVARGDNDGMKPLHIGIAACSAEGAALCYRTICTEAPALMAPHAHPEVSLHTPSLADYMALIYRGDWAGVGEMMLASAHKLKGMGADFLICPDNTIHQALPLIEARSPLPWLHIAQCAAADARFDPSAGSRRDPSRHRGQQGEGGVALGARHSSGAIFLVRAKTRDWSRAPPASPTPRARLRRSARAWPTALLRPAGCLLRCWRSRIAATGRAAPEARTSRPRRCGA